MFLKMFTLLTCMRYQSIVWYLQSKHQNAV